MSRFAVHVGGRPLSAKLAMIAVPLLVAQAPAARADVELNQDAEGMVRPVPRPEPEYYPPPVDGPALRLPESPTRFYLDTAYAKSDDLTALPYIAGKGQNYRLAVGGVWHWWRVAFDAQLLAHLTTLDVTSVLNQAPLPEDAHQTKPSLGDLALGAVWTERLAGEALIAGLGVRGRLATHTTRFQFHLNDGSIADFVIPYYFHIEPTVVVGGAVGRFTYVMNQGAIVLLGPDADFDTVHITVPSIYLWESHYAVGYAPWAVAGASVELATAIQLNHVAGTDFQKFNDIRAVWVAPALQFHFAEYRIDAIARIGLSHGQELYGVLEYVGTHSFTLRASRYFN